MFPTIIYQYDIIVSCVLPFVSILTAFTKTWGLTGGALFAFTIWTVNGCKMTILVTAPLDLLNQLRFGFSLFPIPKL